VHLGPVHEELPAVGERLEILVLRVEVLPQIVLEAHHAGWSDRENIGGTPDVLPKGPLPLERRGVPRRQLPVLEPPREALLLQELAHLDDVDVAPHLDHVVEVREIVKETYVRVS
jgi:hypothetical protein